MPFARPSLEELRARTRASVATKLGLSNLAPRSIERAIAEAQAELSHGNHGHLDDAIERFFPQKGRVESIQYWGDLKGVVRHAATFATGLVTFSGQQGTLVPAGTGLVRDDQMRYRVDAAATIGVSGTVDVAITARAAGLVGNSDAGSALRLASAIAGVNGSAVVTAAGLTGGFDGESDSELLARVLEAWRNPGNAGTKANWIRWTLDIPGVTRAWCIENGLGPGTVLIFFAVDDASYGPIPSVDDVANVRTLLEARRPIGQELFVVAPIAQPLNPTLQVVPDTAAVHLSVEENIKDLLRREASPGGILELSHLREAISLSEGETNSTVYSPTSDVATAGGYLLVLGTVTYL